MPKYSLYDPKWIQGHYQPKIVAYYFREWEDKYMEFHCHDQIEIMYVIKGKCTVQTQNESFPLTKGEFVLLDADVSHRLIVDKDNPCRILNVEFIFAPKNNPCPSIKDLYQSAPSFSYFISLGEPYIKLKDYEELYPALKRLIMELDEKGQGKDIMINLLFGQILLGISHLAQQAFTIESSAANIHIRKAINYFHQNYDRDIKIKDLAHELNIHEGYLYRIFKKRMSMTPIQYLTRLRMEKAKMLLTRTDISIIEISEYIGINSRQYFTSLFKKYTNKTPSEYRNSIDKSHQIK